MFIPGVTDAQEDLEQLRDFVASLKTVKRFEVLPYHTLGVFKWEELGIPYTLSDVMPPDKELSDNETRLLGYYKKLNASGKEKALSYIEGLNDGLRSGCK